MKTDIENKIVEFFSTTLISKDKQDWDNSTDLMENGILDSLSLVKLMVFIEDEFNISLDEYLSFEYFRSINSIAEVVKQEMDKKNSAKKEIEWYI